MSDKHRVRRLVLGILLPALAQGCGDDGNPAGPGGGDIPVQTRSEWLQENGHPIASLTSEDYSDLQFLGPLLSGRRLVQLGESGHGVSEFDQIKVRLIKFLHQELDYDVIAFESSVYECFGAGRKVGTLSATDVMANCIYGVWFATETLPLFEYLEETAGTERPLILAGFDMKTSSFFGVRDRREFMTQVVSKVDAAYADQVAALEQLFYDCQTLGYWSAEMPPRAQELTSGYQALVDFFDSHEGEFQAAYASDPTVPRIARQAARAAMQMVESSVLMLENPDSATVHRDRMMAENLDYLVDTVYPDKKVMVWAHNYHIRHDNPHAYRYAGQLELHTMGADLVAWHRPDLYTVGLYMYAGSAAWNDKTVYTISSASVNSLEDILNGGGAEVFFVDLLHQQKTSANAWMFEFTGVRTWGTTVLSMVPRDQYDALIQVRTVHPPDYIFF